MQKRVWAGVLIGAVLLTWFEQAAAAGQLESGFMGTRWGTTAAEAGGLHGVHPLRRNEVPPFSTLE